MKNREKIILVLAILALLYGALDYFILSSGKDETLPSETENQLTAFIDKTNTTLANLNILDQKKTDADNGNKIISKILKLSLHFKRH